MIENTIKKAKLELAWDYLNNCTYFAKPYYNEDGKDLKK